MKILQFLQFVLDQQLVLRHIPMHFILNRIIKLTNSYRLDNSCITLLRPSPDPEFYIIYADPLIEVALISSVTLSNLKERIGA